MIKSKKSITLNVQGMVCTGCENIIESNLSKLDGIFEIRANYNSSKVSITYRPEDINIDKIIKNIESLDYQVKDNIGKIINESKGREFIKFTGLIIILFAVYYLIENTVGFNYLPEVDSSMGYRLLFLVGLLTSLHCIAMCGGINLSQSIPKGGEELSSFKKLKPSLLYNSGRVISYTVIGGIVGALGSIVSFSNTGKMAVTVFAGVFMIIMGLNMLNIFSSLKKINIRMPKLFAKLIYNSGEKGALYIGILNGFMPCGPLQTMQLYALGTGNLIEGSLSMFAFSLGTVPLMFGLGVISSIVSKKFSNQMMKVSAVLVMILGLIMFNRGINLGGYSVVDARDSGNIATIQGDIQVIETTINSGSYTPFILQKGLPVKWIIYATEDTLNGCNNPLTIPKYNIKQELVPGENIIEFTPSEAGNIVYTCWMGMISSNITVVEDINSVSNEQLSEIETQDLNLGFFADGGCCTESYGEGFDSGKVPTDQIGIAKIKDRIQDISMNVNDYGFTPALLIVQKGIEINWKITAEKLSGCNYIIDFPFQERSIELIEGENEITFMPDKDFYFSCWMGMINGYVKVVDDINNIDLEKIKKEVDSFAAPTGGGCCG